MSDYMAQKMDDQIEYAQRTYAEMREEIDRLTRELAEARETLQFVERWANHHGVKPCVTPAEALGVIQHHPAIVEITDSYADGKRPTTRNPYVELAEAKTRAIPDGWVAVPVDVIDRFPEINPSNYDHDNVCALSAWAVELVLSSRPELPPNGLPKESSNGQ